ncbi:hypothetical protein NBRC10512v2_005890 [Rhodotorula toruloides]|uniref:Uncharacterized protein n=1 Tax=Rhodotorula toruloides (strain NP11) TaxID=1130832 RepID=M7WX15_RHOT1|nr:uncharacterized protein RHTO_07989 [Rhodotorula toruloides NP11]EMS22636.1 hypothetical protein RHTO_07989 [Rhodotorula toruloides NP11]
MLAYSAVQDAQNSSTFCDFIIDSHHASLFRIRTASSSWASARFTRPSCSSRRSRLQTAGLSVSHPTRPTSPIEGAFAQSLSFLFLLLSRKY